MSHPFQVIVQCHPKGFEGHGLLLAGCGPKIIATNLENGNIVSQWPEENAAQNETQLNETENGEPRGKKRKLDSDSVPTSSSFIIKLTISPDQKYAVAVTAEDKCIRVFEITEAGKLIELSQRCMPKRPFAILVTPDNSTIICGDKFGDVYSLPLIPTEKEITPAPASEATTKTAEKEKIFQPSATELTVHTKRNRRALEMQKKQKDLKAKPKEPLKFEHQLLLGHVSMLTDVTIGQHEVGGKTRDFILTADRDEHIRVSRGPPQAYVIERYCLGHTEFISSMCLVPGTNLLVSGGGDDWLGIWDWTTGKLLAKQSLKDTILGDSELTSKLPAQQDEGADAARNIAVSGLWTAPVAGDSQELVLVAACEKVPALFVLPCKSLADESASFSVEMLAGNPIGLAAGSADAIVSIDSGSKRLQALSFSLDGSVVKIVESRSTAKILDTELNGLETAEPDRKQLDDQLYAVERLRKRGADSAEGADDQM